MITLMHLYAFSGKSATHAIIFAQLITSDGVSRGLHPFIVPIRNPKTHLPFPGVTVGDMGEKIGLNGVDNGFLIFNKYSISRYCLLNRTADVTEDGKYVLALKDERKRFGEHWLAFVHKNEIDLMTDSIDTDLYLHRVINGCIVKRPNYNHHNVLTIHDTCTDDCHTLLCS